ncbi:hypothetical protein HGO37_22880 [Rhizobium sp. CG4]|uniref:nucleoside 2-deoxyribosyltransferase n=1 Tax=Rhizobium sp. CG4 TaxID=2726075 RepID=UPI0020340E76|nr:nucleoside 2-deoxyribosyltransferase [Rhizobium sp. CG4]MCM2458244.1 hypothetical protein [Rhizobium sp. CG4]
MEHPSILDSLQQIHIDAASFFESAGTMLKLNGYWDETEKSRHWESPTDYWAQLSSGAQTEAKSIASRLAMLAQQTAPAIRRSPLLSEADEREAGHAFKGMRSALRFRQFKFEDVQVLHDEGSVLGIQAAHESERLVDPFEAHLNFSSWCESLVGRLELADLRPADGKDISRQNSHPIAAGYRPDTAFIMMWISKDHPELEDACNKIKECFRRFGIKAVRADDIEHEDVITQRILDEIKTAEFLIADITGERPSVYYEIGYAHALGRRVTMYRKAETTIHFDIAAYNCPEYANLTGLEAMLMKRLEALTGGPPNQN